VTFVQRQVSFGDNTAFSSLFQPLKPSQQPILPSHCTNQTSVFLRQLFTSHKIDSLCCAHFLIYVSVSKTVVLRFSDWHCPKFFFQTCLHRDWYIHIFAIYIHLYWKLRLICLKHYWNMHSLVCFLNLMMSGFLLRGILFNRGLTGMHKPMTWSAWKTNIQSIAGKQKRVDKHLFPLMIGNLHM